MNLLAIGRTLLILNRFSEAAERLREGLAVAADLDNEELTKNLRTLAAIAAQQQNTE